jgi:hypothetical protein
LVGIVSRVLSKIEPTAVVIPTCSTIIIYTFCRMFLTSHVPQTFL